MEGQITVLSRSNFNVFEDAMKLTGRERLIKIHVIGVRGRCQCDFHLPALGPPVCLLALVAMTPYGWLEVGVTGTPGGSSRLLWLGKSSSERLFSDLGRQGSLGEARRSLFPPAQGKWQQLPLC